MVTNGEHDPQYDDIRNYRILQILLDDEQFSYGHNALLHNRWKIHKQ